MARMTYQAGGSAKPVAVSNSRARHPLTDVFVQAGVEVGLAHNLDPIGASQEGVGLIQATQRNGWRHSTAQAYLRPAKKRANLTIVTDAMVERIIIQEMKATGVVYRRRDVLVDVYCAREVILSAGAIASPKLLLHVRVLGRRALAS